MSIRSMMELCGDKGAPQVVAVKVILDTSFAFELFQFVCFPTATTGTHSASLIAPFHRSPMIGGVIYLDNTFLSCM